MPVSFMKSAFIKENNSDLHYRGVAETERVYVRMPHGRVSSRF